MREEWRPIERGDGEFRGSKVKQEGKQEMSEVSIELKGSLVFLEPHSCRKNCMGLIPCIITKDARSYPMPNGKNYDSNYLIMEDIQCN